MMLAFWYLLGGAFLLALALVFTSLAWWGSRATVLVRWMR